MKNLTATSRYIAITISILIIIFIVFYNSAPLNISKKYSSIDHNTLVLTPKNRLNNVGGISQQTGNSKRMAL
jgi:hypothetical protein